MQGQLDGHGAQFHGFWHGAQMQGQLFGGRVVSEGGGAGVVWHPLTQLHGGHIQKIAQGIQLHGLQFGGL